MVRLLAIGLLWILGVVLIVNYSVWVGVSLVVIATAANFVMIRRAEY